MSEEWSKKLFPQLLHSWSWCLVRIFLDGADLRCKLLSEERGFLPVSALGLSFSGSSPPASAWPSSSGQRGLGLLQLSLSVPSEAAGILGLVSQSATKRKLRCSFFSGLGDNDRGGRCYVRCKGHTWSQHSSLPRRSYILGKPKAWE